MAAAAAARHCARVTMPSVAFECGAVGSSRVKPVRYRFRVSSSSEQTELQKTIREPSRSIRHREFVLPQASIGVQVCRQLSHDGMDGHHPASGKSDLMEQVQYRQPSSQEGDAYLTGLPEKEIERRRKIGSANKGKAPWTKGRKLTKEHKQLIKKRTIEALKDPKVRKKMGHRQLHRQVSKDKISAAQRKIWERRIVSVRSSQMVLGIWSNSIAEAAKEGDHVQDKLDWDSYEKIKSKMISVFLWNKKKWHGRKKELEIVISSRTRKGGGPRKPAAVRRRAVEGRAEVDLVKEPVVPSGRLKELHSPCSDGLPCADT